MKQHLEQTVQSMEVQKESEKENPWSWVLTIVLSFAAALLFCAFIAQPRYVMGDSMQNTFFNRDFIILWKLGYQPQRGDVVVVNRHNPLHEDLIKRVIAVGGDRVAVQNGTVIVNGQQLTEHYIKEQAWGGRDVHITVPAGDVFLMGDNRNHSTDSRFIGPVSGTAIDGKVAVRLFPFDRFAVSFS